MKKIAIVMVIIIAFMIILANFLLADMSDDYRVIKKAVKENPGYEAGKEAKWFKVLVIDNRTKKNKVEITLPLALVEIFLRCTEDKDLKIKREQCDLDLKELFRELKKLGPMALIEIYEDGETVKVWLE